MRSAYAERSTGELVLGPPKSRAGRRIVGIPSSIIPALREHLSVFAGPGADALLFPGAKGGPLRRGNFNKMSAWPHAAIIYQHEARGADLAITSAIDAHIEAANASEGNDGAGSPGAQLRPVNGPLMAHRDQQDASRTEKSHRECPLTWSF